MSLFYWQTKSYCCSDRHCCSAARLMKAVVFFALYAFVVSDDHVSCDANLVNVNAATDDDSRPLSSMPYMPMNLMACLACIWSAQLCWQKNLMPM